MVLPSAYLQSAVPGGLGRFDLSGACAATLRASASTLPTTASDLIRMNPPGWNSECEPYSLQSSHVRVRRPQGRAGKARVYDGACSRAPGRYLRRAYRRFGTGGPARSVLPKRAAAREAGHGRADNLKKFERCEGAGELGAAATQSRALDPAAHATFVR